jgi:DMSO/TMAO reductase YedYZ molybdopterin-dependent catalytic subunit
LHWNPASRLLLSTLKQRPYPLTDLKHVECRCCWHDGGACGSICDRRRFLIKLGGTTALITVAGTVVGELAEARRREAVMIAGGEPTRWSATHPLPNANATVKPPSGTRPEFTPVERHYRIDVNTIPTKVDAREWRLKVTGLVEKPVAVAMDDLQPTNQCTSS